MSCLPLPEQQHPPYAGSCPSFLPIFVPFLPLELSLTQFITAGVPQVHYFGQEGLHNVLVIDLLGPNLEDLFDMCGRKFTIKTVCMAAKQMVSTLPFALTPSALFFLFFSRPALFCLSMVS